MSKFLVPLHNKIPFLCKALVICSLLFTAGCGFHLRGSQPISSDKYTLTNLTIKGKAIPSLIKTELELATSKSTDSSIKPARVFVTRYNAEKRRVGQASRASFDQYLLIKEIEYGLALPENSSLKTKSKNSPALLGPLTTRVESVFLDNTQQALSKANELNLIHQEMERRIAQDMLRQLEMVLKETQQAQQENHAP